MADGSALVTGGTIEFKIESTAQRRAEQLAPDPVTGLFAWTTLEEATVNRNYHSTALLLLDGRLWTGGSNVGGGTVAELRMEVFHPPYLRRGPRPTLGFVPLELPVGTMAGKLSVSKSWVIETPDAAKVTSVAIVRSSSVTHGLNTDQRCLFLEIKARTVSSLVVSAPPNSRVAPPGWYLLFLLNAAGVPSIGRMVKL